jgi:uncharacterized protein YbaP (TraB family)
VIHRNLKIAAILALLLFWLQPAAIQGENQGSFLWRVRSGSTTLHLLGSVHVMKPEAYPLSDPIEAAFERASTVVFEVDLGQLTAATFKLLAEGTLPGGQTLGDVVSPETLELVTDRLERVGMDVEGFERMRPWLLAVTLTTFELTRAGYAQTAGVDMHFFERAKEADKRIVALETVDYQVGLFADLTAEEGEAFLRYTIEELDTIIPVVDELIERWRVGAVDEVESLLTDSYREFPALYRKLVTDRNLDWLPQLEELLAGDEEAMVVVGALHLVGDEGVVELLRREGHTVQQL